MGRLILTAFFLIFLVCPDCAIARKLAFIVGIDVYSHITPSLTSPGVDADKLSATLAKLGFHNTELKGAQTDKVPLVLAWANFLASIHSGDEVVVYYSGHGVEVNGQNFLVPRDTPNVDDAEASTALPNILLSLPSMMNDASRVPAAVVVWILDACRDDPFKNQATGKGLSGTGGLSAAAVSPAGSFIFYAAGFGEQARDGIKQPDGTISNSLYTRILSQEVAGHPHVPTNDLATLIRSQVKVAALPRIQRPAYYDGLDSPWCFEDCATIVTPTKVTVETPAETKSLTFGTAKEVADYVTTDSFYLKEGSNAVFLGKRSSTKHCADLPTDRHPFGCEFLAALSIGNLDRFRHLLGSGYSVRALTNVNVRATIPVLNGQSAIYSCIVDVLSPKDPLWLASVVTLRYLDDDFYWGTLGGSEKTCLNHD